MKLRTQLALTFLALTILPLGGLAGYSYYSSSEAVRGALEEEAADLAREMDGKLNVARQWVAQTIENVEPIAFETLVDEDGQSRNSTARKIVTDMGSVAPLVRSLEFVPAASSSFRSSTSSSTSSAGTAAVSPPPVPNESPKIAEASSGAPIPEPPSPPTPPAIVIDVREALKEVEAEREKIENGPLVGQSMKFAFKVIESIPFEMVVEESMAAMEQGFAEAEAEIAADLAEAESDEERAQLEEKQQELKEARATLTNRSRQRIESVQAERAEGHKQIEAVRAAQRETRGRISSAEKEKRELLHSREARAEHARTTPSIPVVQDGEVVGSVMADVRDEEILKEIFLSTAAQGDEIPFAIDSSGTLYARSPDDEALLGELGIRELVAKSEAKRFVHEDWIIATSTDPGSGLVIGVIRPAAEALAQVRKATIRSLGLGLGLVAICLIGVLPLANHMTRDIAAVTAGAERISKGDLDAEVRVGSHNEVGRLADVFNRMASDLRTNQEKLVAEETARREQEIREQLLKSEYDRTASELEDARQFQLSMLPSSLPLLENVEIAVEMTTATEVGGDYYDFYTDERGLTIAIGDGTGHGAKAGTMVAVIKSLFTALRSNDLKGFLSEASATIRTMQLGRMSMALTLMRVENGRLRFAAAGMPPLILRRAETGALEELGTPGAPLGTIEFPYEESEVVLRPGDTIIAMSDGLPELLDENGDPFGYDRVTSILQDLGGELPGSIIEKIQRAALDWRGDYPQNDDMTLLVLRYQGELT